LDEELSSNTYGYVEAHARWEQGPGKFPEATCTLNTTVPRVFQSTTKLVLYNILNNTTKREYFPVALRLVFREINITQVGGSGSYTMDMENNGDSKGLIMEKELSNGRTPQNVSSSILRKKSDPILVSKIRFKMVRQLLANLQEVILGTKLAVLFPAVPLAIVADFYNFGRVSTHACHSWKTEGCDHKLDSI
jgi:hypothetical protein